MKLNRLLTAIAVTMLSSGAIYAQKVVVDINNRVFIDASGIAHIPTTKAGTADITSKASNEKVYKKFEVENKDNSGSTQWSAANNRCGALPIKDGKWRLPTQRELQLIWVLTPELATVKTFTSFVKENYWSATKDYLGTYILGFNNGYTTFVKGSSCRSRCIREVP